MTVYYESWEFRPISCYCCGAVVGMRQEPGIYDFLGQECPNCHIKMVLVRMPLSKPREVAA